LVRTLSSGNELGGRRDGEDPTSRSAVTRRRMEKEYSMRDIPNFDSIVKIEDLHKDGQVIRSIYVETRDGERLLLRIFRILHI
jgi:predicted acyl esterase